MRKSGWILLCLLLVSVSIAQEGEIVDRVIAVVDDEIILESEVLQIVRDIVLGNQGQYQNESQVQALREEVLNELINQKILLSIASQDTMIVVEEREVDRTLDQRVDQMVRQVGSIEQLESYFGKPIRQIRREFRKQVHDNLMVEKIRAKKLAGVSVSKPEVEKFYDKNLDDLPKIPERVRISHILIPVEPTETAQERAKAKADSLFQELLQGKELESLAIEYSDDRASGAKGGLLGTTERGELLPEYEEVAFALEEGETSSPILSRFGYHIIRLNWRRGEKINTNHILISLNPSSTDEQRAVEQIRDLRERILDGETFAEVAKENSHDDETAPKGGDLGWFDLPTMPKEFKIVVKDLKVGDVSEPFKTSLGIHIIKLTDHATSRTTDLYKDWERISRMAANQKQERIYKEWVADLRNEVFVEIFAQR
ncbi:peptidylprolyl isomerase [bacterium]|nr:peptidylprolyl isomerase [bacterium]